MSIIEDNDQTRARREHLESIRELVGNAYPSRFRRSNVAETLEGEDTISALVNHETIKRIVGDADFDAAFDALMRKAAAHERPTPEDLAPVNEKLKNIEVRTSGRLAVPPRVMGKAAFVHLSDGRERLQIYVRRDDVREMPTSEGSRNVDGWELFGLLDHGDFIGVEGFLFVTKTGELSIHVRAFDFLAKALLPMPDKMHGISDPEIRQRRRYADLIAGSLKIEDKKDEGDEGQQPELTTREVFERRSRLVKELRRYLDDHGYIEVETPMLTPVATGAAAKPFKTHHNALDIDLYARIAPELYLKRLIAGGFERVYELNRNFRNEGVSTRHNPEFTMLEFYCAYMDVNGMMDFCEDLLRTTIEKVTGDTRARFGDVELDFGAPFARLTMKQAIGAQLSNSQFGELIGETFDPAWLDDSRRVRALALYFERRHEAFDSSGVPQLVLMNEEEHEANRLRLNEAAGRLWREAVEEAQGGDSSNDADAERAGRDIAFIFEEVAESELIQPTFIHDFPKPISPLSKASPADPSVAERFELYIVGMECANAFSELNDPVEQYRRFEEQMRLRERGDEEAMQMDTDYVRALSYGMPPTAGNGIGIDRLTMLLTNRRSIRDVILFPHMRPLRPSEDDTTKDTTAHHVTNEDPNHPTKE